MYLTMIDLLVMIMNIKMRIISLRWRQRTVLNEFLRNTEVSRVDQPSEYFQFTENFHGNAPLEVLSLNPPPPRAKNSQGPVKFRYEKVSECLYVGREVLLVCR